MANYFGSICLDDIDEECITVGKNGKRYLNIDIRQRKEKGQFGHTHYIKGYPPKDKRVEGKKYYIGELKPSQYEFRRVEPDEPAPAPVEPQQTQPLPTFGPSAMDIINGAS